MNKERWAEAKRLFDEASDLPVAERDRFLARATDDPEVLDEVRSLLSQLQEDPGFLEERTLDVPPPQMPPASRRIGPWQIVDEVGEGGMGTVYRAVKTGEGFRKTVALKVIRAGMNSAFIVQRFLAERQILASLDHPHIAKFFDGGTTEDGRPYFVMEFIEGEPLVEFADQHKLGLRERVALFRPVCGAVHYAHRNLVVHRDIKPGNVLVTRDGSPCLLDFGLAKLIDPVEGAPLDRTATGFRLLTPEYASPEQVRGDRITTASDVYSLGVVLYRLLAGRGPYRLTAKTPQAALQAVLEKEPESIRGTVGEDLDRILAMAMRKEPERRYASAEDFSEDLRRYLEARPVHARKDTLSYRLSKLAARHRVGVAMAALLFLSMLGGVGATLVEARRARVKEIVAQRRFEEVRGLARVVIFDLHDAIAPLPGSTAARATLVKTALGYLDRLSAEASGDPALFKELADAYQRLAEVQGGQLASQSDSNLGDNAGAETSFRKAIALRERLVEEKSAGLPEKRALATLYDRLGLTLAHRGEHEGMAHIQRALAIREQLDRDHPDDPVLKQELGLSYRSAAASAQADGDLQRELFARRKELDTFELLASGSPDSETNRRFLSAAHRFLGALLTPYAETEARQHLGESLLIDEARASRAPDDVEAALDLASTYTALGAFYREKRNAREALQWYTRAGTLAEAAARRDRSSARPRGAIATSAHGRAAALLLMGDADGAARCARSSLQRIESVPRFDPCDLFTSSIRRATYQTLGEAEEALSLRRRVERQAHERLALEAYRTAREIDLDMSRILGPPNSVRPILDPRIRSLETSLARSAEPRS